MDIDLDDQIRWMAAMIAAGLIAGGAKDSESIAVDSVNLAAAIHDRVNNYAWNFGDEPGTELQPHPLPRR